MDADAGILVIGAGAIGSITAAMVKQQGYHVHLVCRDAELAKKISGSGINIFGLCGDRRVRIPTLGGLDAIRERADTVFLATKAYQVQWIARQLVPLLNKDSRVVSMQNGIVEDQLSRIVGPDRTVGCVVGFGATLHEPGVVEMTSGGWIRVGYPYRPPDRALNEIAKMLGSVVPTSTSTQIMAELYSKLIINSCTSTLGAISGLVLGSLLKIKRTRQLFIAIAREAVMVAEAMPLTIPPFAGRIDYHLLLRQSSFRQHLYIRLFGLKYRKLRSSNLRSLERGRKTEIEFLNGYIVSQGVAYGVETPVNRRLVQMIHEIEHKKRPITPVNLEDEFFDAYL